MNENIIEGNPTKKFFIEMITRDISIEDAILDLLDNSIDGATNVNPNNFTGLTIDLSINNNVFIIKDNCGGFSLETAQRYAFRFGRPDSAPTANNTVGRFGIGMKRSLFKIGKKFIIESQHQQDHFKVTVDVDEWSKKKQVIKGQDEIDYEIDDWNFNYEILNNRLEEDGTIINVPILNNEVADLFTNNSFKFQLKDSIQKILNFSLQKGIKITLNGENLMGKKIEMLISDIVRPYYKEGNIYNVKYRIVAGIGDVGDPKKSGWYIYCNNRLILEADRTIATGWGVEETPQWHNDYVMFRGLLFLDSEEALNLPLTTTKKGIDSTSNVYKAMLPIMKNAMKKVVPFLKKITKLGENAKGYRQMLCETLEHISSSDLKIYDFTGDTEKMFIAPPLNIDVIAQKRESVRIAYDVPKKIADDAKDLSRSTSYKDLGLYSFYYFINMEKIEHE